MPSVQFIPTDDNPRLAIIAQIARLVHDDMNPRDAFLALLGTLRRAYGFNCYVEANTTGLPLRQFRLTRVWNEDGTEAVPDRSPWQYADVPVRSGGVMAEILARKAPCVVGDLKIDPADPVFAELSEYRSAAAVPGAFGDADNWVLIFCRGANDLDVAYLENLVLRVGLVGTALKNLQALSELRRANALIDAEVARIADIQKTLLPAGDPTVPGLEVCARSETFDRAGGDLYDYATIDQNQWGVIIADASGHGPSAAVVAAMLYAILHTFPSRFIAGAPAPELHEVLEFANAQLAEKRIEHSLVTALLVRWDWQKRTLAYARAGHNPAMLKRATGEIKELKEVGDLPLAVLPDTQYHQTEIAMNSGDVLVLYTDGITEAINEAREQFGEDRLRQALTLARGSAGEILETIWKAVRSHGRRVRPRDDQTVVVLRAI